MWLVTTMNPVSGSFSNPRHSLLISTFIIGRTIAATMRNAKGVWVLRRPSVRARAFLEPFLDGGTGSRRRDPVSEVMIISLSARVSGDRLQRSVSSMSAPRPVILSMKCS